VLLEAKKFQELVTNYSMGKKIFFIAIVVAAILSVVLYFTKGIKTNEESEETITTTDFIKAIRTRVNKELAGKDYQAAEQAFNAIMDEIQTEASITNNGVQQLSKREEYGAKKLAVAEYAPIFLDYSKKYFELKYWDEEELNRLKEKSSYLIHLGVIESQNFITSLQDVVDNVNDYNNAWNICNSAPNCSSVDGIEYFISEANRYLRYPLTNNEALDSALHKVGEVAKEAVVNKIMSSCQHTANSSVNFASYEDWQQAYQQAWTSIEEYEEKYGKREELDKAKDYLNHGDDVAVSYFSNNSN